ncbi:hypothetical protein D3C86_1670120 [compost metagenome]
MPAWSAALLVSRSRRQLAPGRLASATPPTLLVERKSRAGPPWAFSFMSVTPVLGGTPLPVENVRANMFGGMVTGVPVAPPGEAKV